MTGKKRAAVCAAVVTACFGSVTALGADHIAPGTAGAEGCVGQTQAFFAQAGKNFDEGLPNGIGGIARYEGVSPSDFHAAAVVDCAVSP